MRPDHPGAHSGAGIGRTPLLRSLAFAAGCVLIAGCKQSPESASSSLAAPPAAQVSAPGLSPRIPLGALAPRSHGSFRVEGSQFLGEHRAHAIAVSGDGTVSIRPRKIARPSSKAHAKAAREWTHGAPLVLQTVAPASRTPPQVRINGDGTLAIERDWAIEKLVNRADGVEQSWSFDRKPEGTDDLMVQLAVDGQRFAGATAQGLHFYSDDTTHMGLRYGLVRWVDARGANTELRPTYEEGRIAIRLPRALLDGSQYPATLDPLVSATEENTDNPVANSTGAADEQAEPGVAFDGTNFFVVWTDNRNLSSVTTDQFDVYGARIDQTGNVLDNPAIDLVTAANLQYVPNVAFGGGQYFAAWTDTRFGDGCCARVPYGARVTPAGVVSPAAGTVASPGGTPLDVDDASPALGMFGSSFDDGEVPPSIASDGTDALVAIGTILGVKGAFLHHDGTTSGLAGRACAVNGPPDAFSCATFYTTTTATGGAPASQTKPCTTDNDCTGPADVAPYNYPAGSTFAGCQVVASNYAEFIADAFNGTKYLLAWTDSRAGGIYGSLVNPLTAGVSPGALLNPVNTVATNCNCGGCASTTVTGGIQIATAAAASGANPTAASNGSGFLVAWQDGRSTGTGPGIYAQRLDGTGALVGSEILIAGGTTLLNPVATYDGANYVIAWGNSSGTNDAANVNIGTLQAARVSPAGTLLDASPINIESNVDLDTNFSDTITGGTGDPGRGFSIASNGLGRTLFTYARYDTTEMLGGSPVNTIRVHARFWDSLPNGQGCGGNNVCASNNCVTGVCCDTTCTAVCNSCTVPGHVGTCTPESGNAGGACGNYLNCVSGSCATSCAGDGDCIPTAYCDNTNHCVPKQGNGSACTGADQCQSGFCCVTCQPAGCNDGNPCTQDSCQPSGCVHVNVTACPAGCSSAVGCGWNDADADGLNDTWESNGYVDNNCNGVNDSGDTPLPGANVNEPDVYVKYDYMVTGSHTHQPSGAALAMVQTAYSNHHTHLHFFPTSDALTHNAVTTLGGGLPLSCTGPDFVNFYTLKAAHFPTFLAPAYHYAVFVHYNTCDSQADCNTCPGTAKSAAAPQFGRTGIAELPGNDLIISLGQLVDLGVNPMPDIINAGTLMHELGHNINLHHGGNDDLIQKPNYISVLNYSYQFGIGQTLAPGPYATSEVDPSNSYSIDYSTVAAAPLHQGMSNGANACVSDGSGGMSEPAGVVGDPASDLNVVDFYANAGGTSVYGPSNATAVDWDDVAPATDLHVYADVAGTGLCGTLNGFNDWQQATPSLGVYQDTAFSLGFQCNTGPWADGVAPPDNIEDRELTGLQVFNRHKLYPWLHPQVDVRPACGTNWIALNSPGVVEVAAYGSATFDATQVDLTSLRFASAAPITTPKIIDVNGDGLLDVYAVFSMSALHLSAASTSASMIGALTNSQAFGGTDSITIVPYPGPVVTLHNDGSGYAATLWPPNHAMVPFTLANCVDSALDRCNDPLNVNQAGHIVRITSDELDGHDHVSDPDHDNNPHDTTNCNGHPGDTDMVITGNSSFQLERERNGSGDGRVYTVTFDVSDGDGNTSEWQCRIQAPHDTTRNSIDSGAKECVGYCP